MASWLGTSALILCILLACGQLPALANEQTRQPEIKKTDSIRHTADHSAAPRRMPTTHLRADQRTPTDLRLSRLKVVETEALIAERGGPERVAIWRDPPFVGQLGSSTVLDDGSTVTYYKITSESAVAIRVQILLESLPAHLGLRFFDSNSIFLGAPDKKSRTQSPGDWWSPPASGESILLEVSSQLQVAHEPNEWLGQISHRVSPADLNSWRAQTSTRGYGDSEACHVNAACEEELLSSAAAVAKMYFEQDGFGYSCSGSLINNTQSTFDPLFLTANHCISEQTVASTLVTEWFYRSPTCEPTSFPENPITRYGGADLLTTDESTDSTLLRLRDTPPDGVYFLGWTTNDAEIGDALVSVHHSRSDVQKITRSYVTGHRSCSADEEGYFFCSSRSPSDPDAFYLQVQHSLGVTEGGSSGSAIMTETGGRVVGTLYGGTSSCSNTEGNDTYGKFRYAYFNNGWDVYLDPEPEATTLFVERFYLNILGRDSDSAGLSYWLNVLTTQSAASVALGFFGSQEFTNLGLNDADFVSLLYTTLFDREADSGGFENWMAQLEAGRPRELVIYGFLRSGEFNNLADSFGVTAFNEDNTSAYGIRAYVERLYNLVLLRQPDLDGFNQWVSELSNQLSSGGDIARGFFFSQEYANQGNSNYNFIETCYQALFGRDSDPDGKQTWMAVLESGGSRSDVLDGFIGSQEFAILTANYGIRAE